MCEKSEMKEGAGGICFYVSKRKCEGKEKGKLRDAHSSWNMFLGLEEYAFMCHKNSVKEKK